MVNYWDKYTEMHGQQNVKTEFNTIFTKVYIFVHAQNGIYVYYMISLYLTNQALVGRNSAVNVGN